MQLPSLSQLITEMSTPLSYRGEYEHFQEIKRLGHDIGHCLVNYPENEVMEQWDGLYERLVGENDAWKGAFLSMVRDAWVENWIRRGHDVVTDGNGVVLLPLAAQQGDKVPYLTMKRCVYEVLKEKWNK